MEPALISPREVLLCSRSLAETNRVLHFEAKAGLGDPH